MIASDGGRSGGPSSASLERRVDSLLRVAAIFRTGVPLRVLPELLPETAPGNPEELQAWFRAHPESGAVIGERVFHPSAPPPGDLAARVRRCDNYARSAASVAAEMLAPIDALACSVALTGSAAYGEPELGDDLDLFIVTRTGATWVVLGCALLRLRLRRAHAAGEEPLAPCLNFVVDDRTIRAEFLEPHDFQFAREALSARPIRGEFHYRQLVRSAAWMRGHLPRLYARWEHEPMPETPAAGPAPLGIRLLNAVLYLPLAAYLQLRGLRRNRSFARAGTPERRFRTRTEFRRMALESERYAVIAQLHSSARLTGATA